MAIQVHRVSSCTWPSAIKPWATIATHSADKPTEPTPKPAANALGMRPALTISTMALNSGNAGEVVAGV